MPRRLLPVAATLLGLTGCFELGLVTDGTSVSMGKPSGGYLVDGVRLPDKGEGFVTRETWRTRDNRYGTDELIDLITGVGRRLAAKDAIRLVVADLSMRTGGEAKKWHRSHQSGRDVDLVYFMRDKDGAPMEADAMRVFDAQGRAKDGSGITVDVPRMWQLVRTLVTAPEATVQFAFLYEPIAQKLLEHARAIGEPETLIARARMTLKQPGDSAPHNDHMHVRVYCSERDRSFGCVDIGPMVLLAERLAERQREGELSALVAALVASAAHAGVSEVIAATTTGAPVGSPATLITAPADVSSSFGRLLRAGIDPFVLRR